jgi:hypothetical protein
MKFTKNLTENPSSFEEIWSIIEGKTIKSAGDFGTEFQIGLSDDYMLRISESRVNLVRTKNPLEKWRI